MGEVSLTRDRADEFARIRAARAQEHVLDAAAVDLAAVVQNGDRVRDLADHGEIVGNEQIGQIEGLLEFIEEPEDLRLNRDIEGGHCLVEHQHLWVENERPRDRDTLPLPSRQGSRLPGQDRLRKTRSRMAWTFSHDPPLGRERS